MTASKRKYECLDVSGLAAFLKKVEQLWREGLTTADIAERLGLHRNTVNQRLRAARKQAAA